MSTFAIPVRKGSAAQFSVIPCPGCGCRSFKFEAGGQRTCAGPGACGLTFDPGPAGRRVTGWSEEVVYGR